MALRLAAPGRQGGSKAFKKGLDLDGLGCRMSGCRDAGFRTV